MQTSASDYFDLEQIGPVTVAKVAVETIRHPGQAQEFGRDLLALVDRDGVRSLIVNLSDTHYLGSTAFGVLFSLGKHLEAAGGKAALCELHPELVPGANILGLGSIVPIFDTQKQALASFRQA